MKVGSLFSGIGGIDLGLERAGMTVVWQAETDRYASRVLANRWPAVPNLGDVTKIRWSEVEPVDIICGGFPCQDISSARTSNARLGLAGDKSGLWRAFAAAVAALHPRWVFVENSPEWQRWMPAVRDSLEGRGYATTGLIVEASTFGAPHRRPRGLVVAHADGESESLRALDAEVAELRQVSGREPWTARPALVGVDDGIPNRVDRLRCLGNACVPHVAEWIGLRMMAFLGQEGEVRQ